MKTVAVKFDRHEIDDLLEGFTQYLAKVAEHHQRSNGLELLTLWTKLQVAARELDSFMLHDEDLPTWARHKMVEALRTAGRVRELQAQVEDLQARAKARGVTAAAQAPSVTKARKKPAHKAKPARKVTVDAPQPAPVT